MQQDLWAAVSGRGVERGRLLNLSSRPLGFFLGSGSLCVELVQLCVEFASL